MTMQMFDDSTPYSPNTAQQLGKHLTIVPDAVDLSDRSGPRLMQPDDNRWYDESLCAQIDSDVFYPERSNGYPNYDTARTICEQCPVAKQCLESAMEAEAQTHYSSRHGMFGGKTPNERAALAREQARNVRR